ncbi:MULTISPECIES: cbb3-type cytochrome c oxidase subunit I [Pseudomonas]|uniref:cytochrome-c oxidase n=1 Tax=Pseudomonas fluorescens LMG 5329 TaxID=1324332 RepID=A0A0A1YWJ2_PSEFL|nr:MULTISPECIES: cbb3-type cytochrome c oxidase subunit I [Pseudomonas]KGE66278.1 membrane protein [Pseudomonas fluorescens LMG 5329]NWE04455.1 cbb3-type cytochrome c oxidase subunit I [Pseudomonas sp. IPO3749]NWF24572.1 cbb3-type cytochrome c oxidase subunit I [Pseudomonas sp. IPO3749]
MSTVAILLSAFILSVVGLLVFIVSIRYGLLDGSQKAAEVIFAPEEIGRTEEPSVTGKQRSGLQTIASPTELPKPSPALDSELTERAEADRSSSQLVFLFLCCAMVWLLVASLAGLTASLKLHMPDLLASQAWLTFGRIRTIHLNAVAYGWAPMAGLGIALFVLPRVLKTRLVGGNYAILGAMMWNAGLVAGLGSIAVGISDGLEWLEIPWQVGIVFVVGGALIGIPLVLTLLTRRVSHLYVSVWYMGCALFWFPVLYLVAKIPSVHFGVEQATMNWWFGHSVLGLFYTPLALASTYYFLPKIIGRPIQSYGLSLLGFWTLAFLYGQVGGHHLVGGPVPGWLVTLSIVQSMMMIIPVIAFSVNLHQTMRGHFKALLYSPTLRFVTLGGMMYTLSSLQGAFEALRSVNVITHFTHYTVAHSHLGLYAFVSFVFFGSIYFIVPRITQREWPYPGLITAHFWCVAIGITIYVVGLTIAGTLQGLAMLDASKPFMDSVTLTVPYLQARSLGGGLMVLGHMLFIANFVCVILGLGPNRDKPALFQLADLDKAGASS